MQPSLKWGKDQWNRICRIFDQICLLREYLFGVKICYTQLRFVWDVLAVFTNYDWWAKYDNEEVLFHRIYIYVYVYSFYYLSRVIFQVVRTPKLEMLFCHVLQNHCLSEALRQNNENKLYFIPPSILLSIFDQSSFQNKIRINILLLST